MSKLRLSGRRQCRYFDQCGPGRQNADDDGRGSHSRRRGDSREARGGGRGGEARAISVVSAAHFVQHFQSLVLPPLFPFLKATLGIGFVELGFALTVASVTAVAAQLPVGFLVDKVGSRLMLVLGSRSVLPPLFPWACRRPIPRC